MALSEKDILQLIQRLDQTRQSGVYENLMYVCYDTIALHSAPLVRTVYGEVTRQLFWGYPLREMHGDRPHANAYFLPYLDSLRDCLVRRNVDSFSLLLEKLHTDETACIIRYLSGLGIREAASIIIPEETNRLQSSRQRAGAYAGDLNGIGFYRIASGAQGPGAQ